MSRKTWFASCVLSVLLAGTALACLWDSDTSQMERLRFPGVLEIITGKFVRHSRAYYEWRIGDRWTTTTGRRLAVRKFESGNSTSTTSPRLSGIVGAHLRPIPVFAKGGQPVTKVRGLRFANSPLRQINGASL
jgi:hypothetical protein